MSITAYREPYKINGKFPFPEFYERFQSAIASVWRPEEVSMGQDVYDWQEATIEERAVIGGILKGFTQLELHVACYWGDVVTKLFPVHEENMLLGIRVSLLSQTTSNTLPLTFQWFQKAWPARSI